MTDALFTLLERYTAFYQTPDLPEHLWKRYVSDAVQDGFYPLPVRLWLN